MNSQVTNNFIITNNSGESKLFLRHEETERFRSANRQGCRFSKKGGLKDWGRMPKDGRRFPLVIYTLIWPLNY